jgi:hypothetical protein
MKSLPIALIVSAIGLAVAVASPAEAAKSSKHKKSAATHSRHTAIAHGGASAGALYNGQDYLGTDPDPNIRSYLIRDLNSRYGGGR